MEEGWRVCLVHGGAARDGGGVVDAAEAVRRVLHGSPPWAAGAAAGSARLLMREQFVGARACDEKAGR